MNKPNWQEDKRPRYLVVNADEGESPAASVVEETGGSRASSAAPGSGQGKGKGRSVAVVPKVRSRLLLEDVKGRQRSRGLSGSPMVEEDDESHHGDDEQDDIEEIPLLGEDHDDLPTISSGQSAR